MNLGPLLASQGGPENDPQQRQLRALQLLQAQQMLEARQREQQSQGLAYQGLRGLGPMGGQGQQAPQMPPQMGPPPQMGGGQPQMPPQMPQRIAPQMGGQQPQMPPQQQPPSGMAWGGGARPFQTEIQTAAQQYGIPPQVLQNLIGAESNFDPRARSPAGAEGIAQFMPRTAREQGVDTSDTKSSIFGAARYLKGLYDQTGSWAKAISAYNRGPTGAQKSDYSLAPYNQGSAGPALIQSARAADQQVGSPQNILTDMPPEQRQQSTQLATAVGSQIPMGMRGAVDPTQLAQAIEKVAPPGTPDDVKGGAVIMLHKLMAPDAQQQFADYLNALKFATGEQDKASTRAETQRRDDLIDSYRQQELRGQAEGRAATASHYADEAQHWQSQSSENKGWEIVQGPDGAPIRVNKNTGESADVDLPQGTTKLGGGAGQGRAGRQAAAQINSMINAGNEASAALQNLVDLPIDATGGWLMGVQTTRPDKLREALYRSLGSTLTSEQAKSVLVSFQGVARSMATLEAAGRATGLVGLTQQAQALMPQQGDSGLTVLRKYAEVRQLAERSIDTIEASPDIGKEQRPLLDKIKAEMKQSVPWSVRDINALERDPSQERVSEFATKMGAAGQAKEGGGQAGGTAKYSVGQIIEKGGKRYRVTGGDPSDPDVEPVQ